MHNRKHKNGATAKSKWLMTHKHFTLCNTFQSIVAIRIATCNTNDWFLYEMQDWAEMS